MAETTKVYIIDDDEPVAIWLARLLTRAGLEAETFGTAEAFLEEYQGGLGCIVLDVRLPGMSGPALQGLLARKGWNIPIILCSGYGELPVAVEALKEGAIDFIEKPFRPDVIRGAIDRALREGQKRQEDDERAMKRAEIMGRMTAREREVARLLLRGKSVKEVAFDLGISHKTVHAHRSSILQKNGVRSVLELAARLFGWDWSIDDEDGSELDRIPPASPRRTPSPDEILREP